MTRQQSQIRRKEEQHAMLRLRISLLSLVAVFAVSMFSAAVASASEGPLWKVGGARLTQGSKGVKLLNKGPLVLKSSLQGGKVTITITCGRSSSDSTIDGNGSHQGQGKGVITYEQCKVTLKEGTCEVVEPIKTNQIKAHLVRLTYEGKEQQNGELFEAAPSQQIEKPFFVKIQLKNCGVLNGPYEVKGSVVGVIEPTEEEVVEGQLHFPESGIEKVKHEGQEIGFGLTLGGEPATFVGQYGAKLQSEEKWGAFFRP